MTSAASSFRPVLRWFDRIVGTVAGTTLFLLMVLTAVDVAGRYLFDSPFGGSLELTEILMSVVIFLSLPLVTARGSHITVDLFDALIPARAKAWLDVAVNLVAAVALGTLSWRLAFKAMQLTSYGDVTSVLYLPLYPLAWVMAAAVGLTAVVLFVQAAAILAGATAERHGGGV